MQVLTPEFSTAVTATVGRLSYLLAESGAVAIATFLPPTVGETEEARLAYIQAVYSEFKAGFEGCNVAKLQPKEAHSIPETVTGWGDVFNTLDNPKTKKGGTRLNKTKARYLILTVADADEAVESFGISDAMMDASGWDAAIAVDGSIRFMAVQAL